MPTRRGFLGSLLGTIPVLTITNPIDFFARTDKEEWQQVILPYRMLFKDSISGFTIQAPGVKEIKKTSSGLEFIANTLSLKQRLRVDKAILLTEQGKVISEAPFPHSINIIPGDNLTVTHNLNFPDSFFLTQNDLNEKQLVELFMKIKYNRNIRRDKC